MTSPIARLRDRAARTTAAGYTAPSGPDVRASLGGTTGYKGASFARDSLAGWTISQGTPEEILSRELPHLRKRSADLIRNNPLAAGAIHTKVQGVVGTGLAYHSAIDREYLRLDDTAADAWEATAERLFRTWAESADCHVKRTLDFYAQQDVAFRSVLAAGDHFVQITRAEASELPFSVALQHIASARVSNPHGSLDTETLAQGVERTPAGTPIAYHVANKHPDSLREFSSKWTRLPAFDDSNHRRVLHLYRALDDDQLRGIPDLAAVIEPLKQLDRYTDAEIDAAVKNSLFAMLVKSPTGQGLAGMGAIDEWAEHRRGYYKERPIALREGAANVLSLFPDDDVQSFDPSRPNSGYDPFVQSVFKQIGVALELPYEVLTKAFMSSYSAARAALLQAQAFFNGRRVWLASAFCQPILAAFIDEQVAAGRLAAPGYFADPLVRAAYLGSEWVGDAPGQIDETKAVAAAAARVQLGVSTLKRETAALTGEDYDHVRRQRDKEVRQGGAVLSDPTGAQPAPSVPIRTAEELDAEDRAELHSARGRR
jgi:lambda family phage portal protein